jgi:hypothetical protein
MGHGVRQRHVAARTPVATAPPLPSWKDSMGQLAAVLKRRLEDQHASLDAARSAADGHLSEALIAEIENLRRIAADHGVALPARA